MKTKILLIRNYQKEISKIMKKDFPIMILWKEICLPGGLKKKRRD
jgi:hypothetical protein